MKNKNMTIPIKKISKFRIIIFSNMRIITKMVLSFIIILIMSIATIGFLILGLKHTENIKNDLNNSFTVAIRTLEAEREVNNLHNNLKRLSVALEAEKSEISSRTLLMDIMPKIKVFKEHLAKLKEIAHRDKWKKYVEDGEEVSKEWDAIHSDLYSSVTGNQYSEALELTDKVIKLTRDYSGALLLMSLEAKESADESNIIAEKSIKRSVVISLGISVVLIAVVALIAVILSRTIFKSLSFFKDIFSRGLSGNLNTNFPVIAKARDEINELGKLFNQFMEKIRGVIKEVIESANDLGVSSEELSGTITSFSDNSQNEAASSEEITATMEEISAGIDNVSENSQFQYNEFSELMNLMNEHSVIINKTAEEISEAQVLSKKISEQAESGNEYLKLMNVSMTNITDSSQQVTDIISIIDDISDKINLLSLNAAIEAARAGEAGYGFAVVADEISKLADQTAASINDIDSLIKKNNSEISNGMGSIVNSTESLSKIIEGVESINNMMNNIYQNMKKQQNTNDTINKSADELVIRSDEVKDASLEQKDAVNEVMKSITNINDLIQASAAGSEEMTANANRLAFMAEKLRSQVTFFKY